MSCLSRPDRISFLAALLERNVEIQASEDLLLKVLHAADEVDAILIFREKNYFSSISSTQSFYVSVLDFRPLLPK